MRYDRFMKKLIVTSLHAGKRLDVFLTEMLGKTRSSIKNLIQAGAILLNGETTAVHHFLKEGEKVTCKEASVLPSVTPTHRTGGTTEGLFPDVIAETDDWMVLDKPAGLLVHPDAKHKTNTLVDWLIEHDPKIARIGEHPERPGIVHRLDREVSGLMVIAKTPRAYDDLQRQFRERIIGKRYLAFTHGRVRQEEGDIKFRIARSTTKARMVARPVQEHVGRAAWTHYRVDERRRHATLLELEILSGRTHQIRAHLQAIGHPIIGDALYATSKTSVRIHAPRLMLQSVFLAFHDPASGVRRSFSLQPDPSFAQMLASLPKELL